MIKHIVCFKLKEGESVDKAIEVLKSMEGKVPSALKIEVGKDFLHSARSYDIILQVTINPPSSSIPNNESHSIIVFSASLPLIVKYGIVISSAETVEENEIKVKIKNSRVSASNKTRFNNIHSFRKFVLQFSCSCSSDRARRREELSYGA